MFLHWLTRIAVVAAVAIATGPSKADPIADREAILQGLQQWRAAFNAKDSAGACDLFAPDLLYSVPDVSQGTRSTMCANLARMLARPDILLKYDIPDVHEVIVADDVAVVRLTWTLAAEVKGEKDTTAEEGMDIFRRQPDGRWSIIRFIAFSTRPNNMVKHSE